MTTVLTLPKTSTCESCRRPGPTRPVRFADGATFEVCARCTPRTRSVRPPAVQHAHTK